MNLLRNKGTHRHNCSVIRAGAVTYIVAYRPRDEGANYENYGPCEFCFGYYIRTDLWKHEYHPQSNYHIYVVLKHVY